MTLRLVAPALRLGGLGDLVIRDELGPALVGRHLRERRGQGGLAVVDMSDRADVHVRLAAVEFLFSHVCASFVVVYVLKLLPVPPLSHLWSRCPESNWRPRPYQGRALPTELHRPASPFVGSRLRPIGRCRRTTSTGLPCRSRCPNAAGEGWSGRRGSNPRPTAWKAVTLPLSYSRLRARWLSGHLALRLVIPLDRTVPTRPASPACQLSSQMRAKVGGEGRTRTFEAARATDLQSAAFDRFATSPIVVLNVVSTRTLRRSSPMELADGFEPPTC